MGKKIQFSGGRAREQSQQVATESFKEEGPLFCNGKTFNQTM